MSSNDLCPIGYSTDYCRRNVPFNMDSSSKSKPANFLQICGNKICDNIDISNSGSLSNDQLLLRTMKQQLQSCQGNSGSGPNQWKQKYEKLKQEVESQALKFQGTVQRVDLESMGAKKMTMGAKRMTFGVSPQLVNGKLKR